MELDLHYIATRPCSGWLSFTIINDSDRSITICDAGNDEFNNTEIYNGRMDTKIKYIYLYGAGRGARSFVHIEDIWWVISGRDGRDKYSNPSPNDLNQRLNHSH